MSYDAPMQQILSLIRVSMDAAADPKHRDGSIRFFKEPIDPLGVRSPDMTKIVASTWRRISGWEKKQIFQLCENLWSSGVFEEGSLACKITARLGKRLTTNDFDRLEQWMNTFVSNWAHCDDLGTHAIGTSITNYPSLFPQLSSWTSSDNRWMRRGATVSLVFPLRKGLYLDEALRLARTLMHDPDDLVQKGIGWMLKEGTRQHEEPVFDFVMANKNHMSRIALRTAIEKLPDALRKKAMA